MFTDLLALLILCLLSHDESAVCSYRQLVTHFSVLLLAGCFAVHGDSSNLGQRLLELDRFTERKDVLTPQKETAILQFSSVFGQLKELCNLAVCLDVSFHI